MSKDKTPQTPTLDRVAKVQAGLGLGRPLFVRSPGRVNLIGEHTDYNCGYVMPGAVDKAVILAFTPRTDGLVNIHSDDFGASYSTPVVELAPCEKEWANLVLGVMAQIQRKHTLPGFDVVYGADLPRGAGLSSSAAVACGVAFGLNQLFGLGMTVEQMAWAAVFAEHEYMGVNCGIMDQLVNLRAREGKLMLIDCRDTQAEYVPFGQGGLCMALCDSQVRRRLSQSHYNKRRSQCEDGVAVLAKTDPGIKSLRDVSLEILADHRRALGQTLYEKCRFIVEENARVLKMRDALNASDFVTVAGLLYASHAGLRDLFKVSCPELDNLVDAAMKTKGVYGARLMGAGFGGCTINIVEENHLGDFLAEMTKAFRERLKKTPKIHIAKLSRATHVVEV